MTFRLWPRGILRRVGSVIKYKVTVAVHEGETQRSMWTSAVRAFATLLTRLLYLKT
jgi:hypothetical protein